MNGPTYPAKVPELYEYIPPRLDAALEAMRSDRDVWHAVALDAIAERDKLRAALATAADELFHYLEGGTFRSSRQAERVEAALSKARAALGESGNGR